MIPVWRDSAACLDQDPDLFVVNVRGNLDDLLLAAAICACCPVYDECRDDAIAMHANGVIRAGHTISDDGSWREITARRVRDAERRRNERGAA